MKNGRVELLQVHMEYFCGVFLVGIVSLWTLAKELSSGDPFD